VSTIIYPEWLVEGTGAAARQGAALRFVHDADGRIDAISAAGDFLPSPHDVVVRAPGQTLLPGLVNMHAHLTLVPDNAPFIPYMDAHSDVALGLRAAHNALAALRAGVTTVRDCGSRGRSVLDVRDALNESLLPGPRIVAAGAALTISGGHMRPFGGECDGIVGVRQMVRHLVSAGSDFLKVAGSGGGTPGSLTEYPSFLSEEFAAIVETAHGLGRRVTVHCTATAAIARAVDAGVDSLEHGYFMAPGGANVYDDVLADRLASAGISVTPTLQVFRDMATLLPPGPERDFWAGRREQLVENVGRVHRAGVRLTAGSDAGWRLTRFDTYSGELVEMASAGLSALEVIHAATGAASSAIGRADEFGTLRQGLSADLLLVQGNVADDIRRIEDVRGVYLRGRAVPLADTAPQNAASI
jgi:imidazolonepropionase-like amidohydrolase